jgi:prefoldin subunit 5
MHEDVNSQLIQQATDLTKEIRSVEANLVGLKESYLKVQGALELLSHLNTLSGETDPTASDKESNVEGTEPQ